jgi:hypothetical protein
MVIGLTSRGSRRREAVSLVFCRFWPGAAALCVGRKYDSIPKRIHERGSFSPYWFWHLRRSELRVRLRVRRQHAWASATGGVPVVVWLVCSSEHRSSCVVVATSETSGWLF